MNCMLSRRLWMTALLAASTSVPALLGLSLASAPATCLAAESGAAAEQEYYELRIYRNTDPAQQKVVGEYVQQALLPALGRQGIDRIGVFTPTGETKDASLYVLIPYRSLDQLGQQNAALAEDKAYQSAAADFFALPKETPAYERIESRLMKAFAGMPVIELPAESQKKAPRIFELRIYESHNADKARLKVEMFNKGEIDIMKAVKMAPVFYGETLISNDAPNLTYLLSASDAAAHKEHWDAFRTHPDWDVMKKLDRYKDTVTKIHSVMLEPTAYSQI
ncbi:NIPSNAP family protein [Lignipirellula cremea]|uniref:NIPSNAP domain-containing protein n=1 Tax=Lignipirellula cremea TaxID=2528010 RepID=A0A518E1R2_9BACT|nr:NIPSNAP family protein [Lignipirellula cremea]QDU98029.1 hypothetical protein Pla8534_58900 [Lignipirellula cremea]